MDRKQDAGTSSGEGSPGSKDAALGSRESPDTFSAPGLPLPSHSLRGLGASETAAVRRVGPVVAIFGLVANSVESPDAGVATTDTAVVCIPGKGSVAITDGIVGPVARIAGATTRARTVGGVGPVVAERGLVANAVVGVRAGVAGGTSATVGVVPGEGTAAITVAVPCVIAKVRGRATIDPARAICRIGPIVAEFGFITDAVEGPDTGISTVCGAVIGIPSVGAAAITDGIVGPIARVPS